jgi:RND family efflux transporter MFP subunit
MMHEPPHHPDDREALYDTGTTLLHTQVPSDPNPPAATDQPAQPLPGVPPPSRGRGGFMLGILVLLVLGVFIVLGIRSRQANAGRLRASTETSAVPYVRVTLPTPGSNTAQVSLPANVTAFIDTPIYARTSGYLKQWYFDIGARVPKGALLAVIESPEIDQQVNQAEADVKTAQSNLKLAQITATRWEKLLQKNAVSHQEADQAVSDLASRQSALAAQQANLQRLQQMQGFEKIYAPFAGIVTARNVDVGSLIDAGSGAPQKELFHLASVDRLRVFVPVPEVYQSAVHDGEKIPITVDAFPNQEFWGTLARNSHSVDTSSRTLDVEVDVNNTTGKLLPGAYAFVHLPVPSSLQGLRIPANALLFRAQGTQVAVVRNERVVLQDVKIGHDYGDTVEVIDGLSPQDQIVLDPSDSLEGGDRVQIENTPTATGGPA